MNNIVISISGDYRSGKSGIADKIASHLNIPHYSMRKLYNNETYNNRNHVNWFGIVNDNDDDDKIDNYIAEQALKGNCILDFRFSAIICKKLGIEYKGIWVSSDIVTRVKGNAYAWGKSEEETLSIIEAREQRELETALNRYGATYAEPSLYHYFVDLTDYWYPIPDAVNHGMKTDSYIKQLTKTIIEESSGF